MSMYALWANISDVMYKRTNSTRLSSNLLSSSVLWRFPLLIPISLPVPRTRSVAADKVNNACQLVNQRSYNGQPGGYMGGAASNGTNVAVVEDWERG